MGGPETERQQRLLVQSMWGVMSISDFLHLQWKAGGRRVICSDLCFRMITLAAVHMLKLGTESS